MTQIFERRAGLLVPLFSMPASQSWGIGEIADLEPIAAWLDRAAIRVLQLLPINEMDPRESSPYSAISAMAIDPQFIALARVSDLADARQHAEDREIADLQQTPRVVYSRVRPLKQRALRTAFSRFVEREWKCNSPRAAAFRGYIDAEQWWLDDYAVFRALFEQQHWRPWTEWPDALRHRDPDALDRVRRDSAEEILFYRYVQWIADSQWQEVRRAVAPVALFGDFPFMVALNSADVWANQQLFRFDASIGVPPDAFSEMGQNWGLPVYRWDRMEATGDQWIRDRIRRSDALYDGYRIDHLVGFYRTYAIPHDERPRFFIPEGEAAQLAQGERLMARFLEANADIVAEDLGTVPDFVRESLGRLGLPGIKILRWERHWHDEGHPFRDPRTYPARSVAASGTHDTEPMAVWWDRAPADERAAVARTPGIAEVARDRVDLETASFDGRVRDVLIEALYASGSNLLILPIQDVFGWRDRINEPATVRDENWTYRLPWPVDRLDDVPEARERAETMRRWAEKYGRTSDR